VAITAAAAFLSTPALAGVPARLIHGCGRWIAAAGVLEVMSSIGFVVFFRLVFTAPLAWRRVLPAALRALGATTILPAGGLVGPAVGAWSTSAENASLASLTRSTVTFVILTNLPEAMVLVVLGPRGDPPACGARPVDRSVPLRSTS
jgi:hypothetical protein